MEFEKFAETTAFKKIAQTIAALSTQDERIADEFRAIEQGRVSSGKIVEIEGDIPLGMKMKFDDFAEAISTRVWESVGRVNWRRFEDARRFTRGLVGVKSQIEWQDYCASGKRPSDIPANPQKVYVETGWAGYGDWLGTGAVSSHSYQPLSFKKARAYVNGLGLKSEAEWRIYLKSGKKPDDIPTNPHRSYLNEGWSGIGDWLGTGRIADRLREYRPFDEARNYVHGLALKSLTEWHKYCASGDKPEDIPATPNRVYTDEGWSGWGDWFGTGTVASFLRKYRSFEMARAFVRDLNLKSQSEWRAYVKSDRMPDDIPANPDRSYAEAGWVGYGDWLGTGVIAPQLRQFRSFPKARHFVHGLGLKSETEWREYCKSGAKPIDIPLHADRTYAQSGWIGMSDWLGTSRKSRGVPWRPFEHARAYVRDLGLRSEMQWRDYCRSGRKPNDIPSNPQKTYGRSSWAGIGDWLGYVR
jgi:hypothetical protein